MSNVSTQEPQGIIGKVALFPIEVVKFGIVSAANLIIFAGTTSINIASNVLNTVSSVLQGLQSVITPKK